MGTERLKLRWLLVGLLTLSVPALALAKPRARPAPTTTTTTTITTTTSTTLAPVAPSNSSLLNVNPGFESGLSPYVSWGNAFVVTGQARSGSYSLQVAGAAGGMGRDLLSLVSAGQNYELSVYGKTTNPSEYAEVGVTFKSSSNVVLLNRSVMITSTSYALYKISFTAPAGATYGELSIWKNAGTSALNVDDFSLVSLSGASAPTSPVVAPAPTAPSPIVSAPVESGTGYPFGSRKVPYVAGIKVNSTTQAAQDQSIKNLYDYWKTNILKSGCGGYYPQFNQAGFAAVSEGVGYAMMITALMDGYDPNAKIYFDGIFKFARSRPAYAQDAALMEWRIRSDCSSGGDGWAAPDGDLDIAMGLLMADRQWGSAGAINYKAEAIKTINALKVHGMMPSGYPAGGNRPGMSRTSDAMFTHFRSFKKATGDAFWDTAVNNTYALFSSMQAQYSPYTGLLPDFYVGLPNSPSPSPGGLMEGDHEGHYYWNACRNPWRIASDYVTTGDPRAAAIAGKMEDFFVQVTGGNPALIAMGYRLDGSVIVPNSPGYVNPVFSGPVMVGALVDSRFQNFLNASWDFQVSTPARGYYDTEIQMLSMIVASGNWWNP